MAVKKKVTRKKAVTKKRPAKKPARKPARAKKAVKKSTARKPKENIVGTITHYFPKVQAAVIKLKAPVGVGDTLKFKGHTTDFTQSVTSMQINHVPVTSAKKGEEIGLLVNSRVREHDVVIKE
jgi:putative protease